MSKQKNSSTFETQSNYLWAWRAVKKIDAEFAPSSLSCTMLKAAQLSQLNATQNPATARVEYPVIPTTSSTMNVQNTNQVVPLTLLSKKELLYPQTKANMYISSLRSKRIFDYCSQDDP